MILLAVVSCDSTPDHVIPPEKMARLLADIHIGESVIDANRNQYANDSLKKELKQSVFCKHNVTAQQVDTSFVWYGHNIEKYIILSSTTLITAERLLVRGEPYSAFSR